MRIGEVNKDNYKFFLQMLGAKSSKALDAIFGSDEKKGISEKDVFQKTIKDENYLEGMTISENDTSWHKIVPVSDEVRNKIIETVRKEFLENGNGMSKDGGSRVIPVINREYLKSLPPNERLSATWTLGQIMMNEEQRLVDYVKKMDPTWTNGKRFDKSILINSNFGTNTVDVKA